MGGRDAIKKKIFARLNLPAESNAHDVQGIASHVAADVGNIRRGCPWPATIIAIWRGSAHGDAAKTQATKAAVGVSISGSIVDANEFANYVKALDKLAIAMNRHSQALDRQHEVKHTNALEELAEKIDKVLDKL